MKKNLSIQGYHRLIMCPQDTWSIGGGAYKAEKTYENFFSVFGYNLAKQKKKSVCKNAGI
jgi:hypothetical protein